MLTIPTRTDSGNYIFSVELEEIVFFFEFYFNERDQSWFFDLLDSSSNVIRYGIKCVTNWQLLQRIATAGRPPGEVVCGDTTGEDRRAGLEDLGDEIDFVYFLESEVEAATA
jgi:hypothetical protein